MMTVVGADKLIGLGQGERHYFDATGWNVSHCTG